MLQPLLRPCLALLLLLCLGRTLLPEAWVLALHHHAHTTELKAPRHPTGQHQQLLSTQHTHCHAAQFYNVPFVLGVLVRVPRPRARASYRVLAVPTQRAALAIWQRCPALRGPPRA